MAAASGRTAEFVKYQGLGNDFILVDNTMSSEPIYSPEEAIKLCNRNFGIGADGLIFAMPGKDGSDYTMRIYNSDGSEPQMCGNGIRCMAKYLQKLEKKESEAVTYTISTKAGLIVPVVAASGLVTVDMGLPITNARQVPSLLALTMGDMAVDSNIDLLGKTYKTTAVSMGNPHAVRTTTN
jgi:diaminopimelate epimerase